MTTVTNSQLLVHGFANLRVCDSSVFGKPVVFGKPASSDPKVFYKLAVFGKPSVFGKPAGSDPRDVYKLAVFGQPAKGFYRLAAFGSPLRAVLQPKDTHATWLSAPVTGFAGEELAFMKSGQARPGRRTS